MRPLSTAVVALLLAARAGAVSVTPAGLPGVTATTNQVTINNQQGLTVSSDVYAHAYHGSGAYLTGVASPPGGSNTQVQYNDSSAFAGDPRFFWTPASAILQLGLDGSTGNGALYLDANSTGGSFTRLRFVDGGTYWQFMGRQGGSARNLVLSDSAGNFISYKFGGGVGLNVADPTRALDVSGEIHATDSIMTDKHVAASSGTFSTMTVTNAAFFGVSFSSFTGLIANNDEILLCPAGTFTLSGSCICPGSYEFTHNNHYQSAAGEMPTGWECQGTYLAETSACNVYLLCSRLRF